MSELNRDVGAFAEHGYVVIDEFLGRDFAQELYGACDDLELVVWNEARRTANERTLLKDPRFVRIFTATPFIGGVPEHQRHQGNAARQFRAAENLRIPVIQTCAAGDELEASGGESEFEAAAPPRLVLKRRHAEFSVSLYAEGQHS